VSDAISATGLTKRYGGTLAVDRLDLAVPEGAVYALLGGNGAGKSTTIKMLCGLVPPDAGRAVVLGRDAWAAGASLRHEVGYVPERPKFYDWMTVSEIGWFTAGFHRPGYLDRYLALAARFELPPAAKLKSLSKGGYAKVGLALALAADPKVLMLDEPTSGLDLFTRRDFLAQMVELAGDGRTVLISSHQLAEVDRVASHAAFLAGGRLLLAGSLDELRARVVGVSGRYEGDGPDLSGLGTVLTSAVEQGQFRVVLRDPPNGAVTAWCHDNTADAVPLTLEEMYIALLSPTRSPMSPSTAEPLGAAGVRP
jgi:ABC-2 type transport system ATP-binding protein